jgi:hypothetical protein
MSCLAMTRRWRTRDCSPSLRVRTLRCTGLGVWYLLERPDAPRDI